LDFDVLKDKLKDQWAEFSSKVQESSTFNTVRENFESQTPVVQKAILAVCGILLGLFILSFPFSYISQSREYLDQFEETRGLIQGLLRASRAAKEPSPLPPQGSTDMIKSRVDNILRENRIVPEQIGESAPLPESHAKALIPASVHEAGLAIQIKKLNLQQIVALNTAFQNIGPGIKLIGLDIVQAADQTHYYDMVAKIIAFSLPQMTFESEPGGAKGKGARPGGAKPSPKPETDEEGGE
jgi:hypothetical protein